jgi:hypothetical protein
MARPMIRIHDTINNEIIDREMNDEEFAQYQNDQVYFAEKKKLQEEQNAKRIALLEKLGITDEEAKLLLG